MSASITWPDKYLPGYVDNFVSNEVVVAHLSPADVWPLLADITRWESYYDNCSQITPPANGPQLKEGDKFSFSTFGFPPLDCTVRESQGPSSGGETAAAGGKEGNEGQVLRLAWEATGDGFACYHAWVLEGLSKDRVRILTQESQVGPPAKELAGSRPNKMLNGHQAWLDGLVGAVRKEKGGE